MGDVCLISQLQAIFVNRLEIIVKKKKTIAMRVEEQWVSEKEMKTDLGWSPTLDIHLCNSNFNQLNIDSTLVVREHFCNLDYIAPVIFFNPTL